MNMLTQLPGKVTKAHVEQLGSTPLLNVLTAWIAGSPRLQCPNAYNHWHKMYFDHNMGSGSVVATLAAANVIMRGYEGSPGCWMLNDSEVKLTWVIFSDGWKKDPWKGTSYEVIVHKTLTDEQWVAAIDRLVATLRHDHT